MKRYFLTALAMGLAFFCVSAFTPFVSAANLSEEFASLLPNLASAVPEEQEKSQQRLQELTAEAGAPGSEKEKAELNHLMAEQLSEPIDPVAKTWILFQLGRIGTDAEVDSISPHLSDSDIRVRQQAIRTLAQIKTEKAVDALKIGGETAEGEVKSEIEQTLRVISYDFTIPAETEWPLCLPYSDDAEVEAWMAGYDHFDVTAKARTLASLAVRGDRKYRSYAVEAASSSDPDLKRDGLLALEKLGTTDDIPLLLDNALLPDWERIALIVADRVEYPGFDEDLLARIEKEENADRFCNLVKILVARWQISAVPAIMDGAARWPEKRVWILGCANRLMGKEDIPRFIQLMLTVESQADREALEKVLQNIINGDAAPVISQITDANRSSLMPLLGRIGDKQGFDLLAASLKSKNPAERDAAVKGFCNAPNAQYAETLLEITNDVKMSGANRVAAFRAYVRVISLPEDEIGIEITDQEKLAKLRKAFEMAGRDEDKILVLDRVKSIRIPESLAFVLPFVDDQKFEGTATETVLELAHHDFLRKMDPEAFSAVLDKIIEKGTDPGQVDRAKRYREAIK